MKFSYEIKSGFGVGSAHPSVHVSVFGGESSPLAERFLLGRLLFPDFRSWDDFKAIHFPQACMWLGCTRLSEPGCTIRDPESLEDLPACREHADEAPEVAA